VTFFNICKYKFRFAETAIAAFLIYRIPIAIFAYADRTSSQIDADILSNLFVVASLAILANRKTKNRALSIHFALLTMIISMIASTIIGVFVQTIFDITLEELRNDALKYAFQSLLIIVVCYCFSKFIGNPLSQQNQIEEKAQKSLEDYTKKLENDYHEMRLFRHDHLETLHGLIGYISDNDIDGLKIYLKENVKNVEKALAALDKSMDKLQNIRIPELKGGLFVKFSEAQSQGIELKLDIARAVEQVSMEKTELCRVVGIMVNNAVEELIMQDHGRKILNFGIIIDEDSTLIICSNTCKTLPLVEKIFEKGYSTKGSDRGLGLYNLEQICEKCGNVLVSAYTEDDLFTIMLTIRDMGT